MCRRQRNGYAGVVEDLARAWRLDSSQGREQCGQSVGDGQGGTEEVPEVRVWCWVAELTTGKVAAYAVPWSQAYAIAGRPIKAPLVLLDVYPMRTLSPSED